MNGIHIELEHIKTWWFSLKGVVQPISLGSGRYRIAPSPKKIGGRPIFFSPKWLSFTSGWSKPIFPIVFLPLFPQKPDVPGPVPIQSGVHITSVDCNNRWIPPWFKWQVSWDGRSVDGASQPTSNVNCWLCACIELLETLGLFFSQDRGTTTWTNPTLQWLFEMLLSQDTHGHQLQSPIGDPIFEAKEDADRRHMSLANLVVLVTLTWSFAIAPSKTMFLFFLHVAYQPRVTRRSHTKI